MTTANNTPANWNSETVRLSFPQTHVGVLTIDRAQALNALSAQVLSDLSEALSVVEKSPARVLVITGAGEKAFVAGADIKEINSLTTAAAQKFAEKGQSVFRRIETMNIPVIAAVNGFALGGGLELALSCDFIYASENARVGLPEVTLGLIPGFGGTVRLSRVVGLNVARELIFRGDMLTSVEALQYRIVNKVLPLAELMPAVLKVAETIALRGPIAVKQAKKSVLQTFDQEIDHAMNTEAALFSELFNSQDVKEGTSAFLEKRKANFAGK